MHLSIRCGLEHRRRCQSGDPSSRYIGEALEQQRHQIGVVDLGDRSGEQLVARGHDEVPDSQGAQRREIGQTGHVNYMGGAEERLASGSRGTSCRGGLIGASSPLDRVRAVAAVAVLEAQELRAGAAVHLGSRIASTLEASHLRVVSDLLGVASPSGMHARKRAALVLASTASPGMFGEIARVDGADAADN